MYYDDETPTKETETGSDELLSDDQLRLPEHASILVRVHAVEAWLVRRRKEASLEIGDVALAMQEAMQSEPQETRPRRRERERQELHLRHLQQDLVQARERLATYEEAQALLEECIAHTSGERVLVEYYLALEDLVQSIGIDSETTGITDSTVPSPRLNALADVQHRVEHVGAPVEDD